MRPKIRLYIDAPLAPAARIPVGPGQAHYLLAVMRKRAGDVVLVFNGREGEWSATLAGEDKRRLELLVESEVRPQQDEPGPDLLFAPIKRARLEILVEKATELGVRRLVPVQTRRAVVDRLNLDRLRAIVIEAAEQSRRLSVPEIAPLRSLDDALLAHEHPILLADETGGGVALPEAIRRHGPGDLLTGPEGGFDPAELAALRSRPNVIPVSLGDRILRAETAAIAALAVWRAAR